ncbi:MAG: hypothetical protein ABJA78_04935 [Ferruginibacter sp.]
MKLLRFIIFFSLIITVPTSCNNYGKKLSRGRIVLFYKNGVSDEQAKITMELLSSLDSLQADTKKDIRRFQLIKKNDTFCFRKATEKIKADTANIENFIDIGNFISSGVFDGAPVNIELTNDEFETLRSIPYKKTELEKLTDPADIH